MTKEQLNKNWDILVKLHDALKGVALSENDLYNIPLHPFGLTNAARLVKHWPVIEAWHANPSAVVEYSYAASFVTKHWPVIYESIKKWDVTDDPSFDTGFEYRIKPSLITVEQWVLVSPNGCVSASFTTEDAAQRSQAIFNHQNTTIVRLTGEFTPGEGK